MHMNEGTQAGVPAERPGHHWRNPDRAREYVQRMDALGEERQRQFELLVRLLPYPRDAAIRVLDIGAGHGAAAAAVLASYPRARALLLDISPAMIELGRERLACFAGRYRYLEWDFVDGSLPQGEGPFQVVVSSLAIHHLPAEATRRLYREARSLLAPGGCFLNLDIVAAPTPALEELYRRLAEEGGWSSGPSGRHSRLHELGQHLEWLREAGFAEVDCFWKQWHLALFGGFVPGA